jgi:hypothetical protein
MAERALSRSARLWSRGDLAGPAEELFRSVERFVDAEGGRVPGLARLVLRLARAVGVDPDALDAEGGVGRDADVAGDAGVCVRVSALASLLCVAGAQALDPRAIDEVAVEHLGRDDAFSAPTLLDALDAATWLVDGDRHVLCHACAHPVIDFVLRDLADRADFALQRVRAKPEATRGLGRRLPARVAADRVRPAPASEGPAHGPAYELPHVRFRLDQDRVRAMLMGEELYGDPCLAVRELYQNALDACRYRRARVTMLGQEASYAPRIVFRQGRDEGRLYIECEDNGVGMSKEVLERVFAVAGRRFHDMPDFLEERARWQAHDPPIELHPNSQFGIGVLSYFMLADEVCVWTRRYEADGRLAEPLAVRISSGSGLFRVEPAREELDAGTRVRLYLQSETNDTKSWRPKVSCSAVLRAVLWVAEVTTSVEEDGEWVTWKPGALTITPEHTYMDPPELRPTVDPDVWWSTSGSLLSDGLTTETRHPCVIANLHGRRLPELSVDRKKVRSYDEAWIERVMAESWKELVGWDGLSTEMLWALDEKAPASVRRLVEALPPNLLVWDRFRRTRVPLDVLGCFSADDSVALARDDATRDPAELDIVTAWRVVALARAGLMTLPARWPAACLLDEARDLVARPGDALLLAAGLYSRVPIRTAGPLHVLRVAHRLEVAPRAVLERIAELSPLGLEPPALAAEALETRAASLDDEDRRVLFGRPSRWANVSVDPWSMEAIIEMSKKLDRSPAEIVSRLEASADLGVQWPRWIDTAALRARARDPLSDDDALLLGAVDDDERTVSISSLVRMAEYRGIPLRRAWERLASLAPLGFALPAIDPRALDVVRRGDGAILGWYEALIRPLLAARIPRFRLLQVLWMTEWREPVEIRARIASLAPLGVHLPPGAAEQIDATGVDEEGRLLLATHLAPLRVIEVARQTARSLGHVLGVAERLGMVTHDFAYDITRIHGDYVPDADDERAIDAGLYFMREARRGPAAVERFRRDARYRLWHLDDAAFAARFARLRPLVACALDGERIGDH